MSFGQNVELFTQWNGRYDFTFVGNTLNPNENSYMTAPTILDSSSADLNLTTDDTIVAAYLYWAGSGTGDFDIKLNGTDFSADIQYNINGTTNNLDYFSAFSDITSYVQTTGSGTYTFSDLDLSAFISDYFYTNKTNFAGWSILVIYENPSLTLNQINIYQGLEALSPISPFYPNPLIDTKTIILDNLYLISNTGAKIGFIAWEGDAYLGYEESLKFSANGSTYTLSNSLNPSTNAFNNTNTESFSNTAYNMDLDVYSIESYVVPGTTFAEVTLQSGWDYVMLNTIITKLNSQLPDATIVLDDYTTSCNEGAVTVDYTVYNINSTEILTANTQIGFYIGSDLIGTSATINDILIGESESGTITLNLPSGTPEYFTLTAFVDDITAVTELVETNNTFNLEITQWLSPEFNILEDLVSCNLGLTRGIFDFSEYEFLVTDNSDLDIAFYETYEDAENNANEIFNTSNYESITTPNDIFIRLENDLGCYSITSFNLLTENCPPTIYNAVSANNDGMNDDFFIDGLRDIFVNFKIEIYNRWGKLLWVGDNSKPNWSGYVEEGVGTKQAPEGTYFYILYLNDPDYGEALTGYLYLTR
jgi:gliding motility-associated-like protein